MGAIDIHTHAFPDELAPRAMTKLQEGCSYAAVGDGTVKGLLASMDEADVDISLVCTIATKADQPPGILKWCRRIASERIVPVPSVHPHTPKPAKWIEEFAEAGFPGIKLHPMYQDVAADDPALDPIYAAASQHGLFVTSHCGRDIAFPPEDDRAAPARFRRVLERFPDLRLLCTHMGGWSMWEEVERELIGQDVLLETSFSIDALGAERAADMIRRHGVDNVLLGSDWPWRSQTEAVGLVSGLGFSEPDTRKLLYANAVALLGF
jgi:predicted TIM-barrel fold metal-dependent hydrolase